MLLLPTVPDRVLLSTAVVAIAAPFQRMAAWAGKFVPVTFSVVDCEPALMVCGETWVIAGVADCCCCDGDCPVVPDEQPRQ